MTFPGVDQNNRHVQGRRQLFHINTQPGFGSQVNHIQRQDRGDLKVDHLAEQQKTTFQVGGIGNDHHLIRVIAMVRVSKNLRYDLFIE